MRTTSYRFRVITSERDVKEQTAIIEAETSSIYHRIAAIVGRPGMPWKTIDLLVSKALDDCPLWRTRAIRLKQGGHFSAAAVRQIQDAYLHFMARHEAQVASAAKTERVRQAALSRNALVRQRDQIAAELARLNSRLAMLDGGPS